MVHRKIGVRERLKSLQYYNLCVLIHIKLYVITANGVNDIFFVYITFPLKNKIFYSGHFISVFGYNHVFT